MRKVFAGRFKDLVGHSTLVRSLIPAYRPAC